MNTKSGAMGWPDPDWSADIPPYLAGDTSAGDRLSRILREPVRLAVVSFLGDDNEDANDVIQESILAVLLFVRREEGFEGDFIRFAVTVARNRCRNILNWRRRHPRTPLEPLTEWLADPHRSPLDLMLESERMDLMWEAVDSLDQECRDLLVAYFIQKQSSETLRRRFGLKTVQGIHYRKSVCLERAHRLLIERLDVCSGEEDHRDRAEEEDRT